MSFDKLMNSCYLILIFMGLLYPNVQPIKFKGNPYIKYNPIYKDLQKRIAVGAYLTFGYSIV